MPRKAFGALIAVLLCLLSNQSQACAQAVNNISHLTIYSAGIGEFLEERSIDLQQGLNTIEWRSLMPKAYIRTLRVTAEDAEVVRQDVTYDGSQVNNEKSPVLHLVIQNRGSSGSKRVQIDYLAPGISWQGEYALLLEATSEGDPPTSAVLDSWVSINNISGVDLAAGSVDLVAGEIALLTGRAGGSYREQAQMNVSQANAYSSTESEAEGSGEASAEVSSLSAFNRFALGKNIDLTANATVSRFPIFQHARISVVQRNVFENTHDTQTLGRGGFILLPRGLEVRLVAKNTTVSPLVAGLVSIYQRSGAAAQIVGQDQISFTPRDSDFSVTQGRSATLFGTRRVLERTVANYRDGQGITRERLTTKVEVVLTNRGSKPAEAFVREGVERFANNQWKIVESTIPSEVLQANTVQFKASVPANGTTKLVYTVECQ
jgi:hypothetical protein